jgi:hypothetical protein
VPKMAINRYKPRAIVAKLQKVRVPVGQGVPRVDAIRQIRVTDKLITAEKYVRRNGALLRKSA